ncbi:reverse transcriptase domain-containing protein [Tanacetum coccineum]|uniref:Reverse transcriptase domain-containing protein n=1 Tax=Tanacetum coccineum TaxID=301880 RepID=A0ABQ5GNI8_9ASTR
MDDEPPHVDPTHVVAPTPGSTITILKTANEFAIKADSFPLALFDPTSSEKSELLSQHENESLTDAWLRMKEMLQNCHGHNLFKGNIIKIFYQVQRTPIECKQTKPVLDEDNIPMSREEEAKFMQTFRKTRFYNDYRDRDSNCDNWHSNKLSSYNRDNYRSNTDDKPYDLQKQFNDFMKSQQSTNTFVKETFMDLKTQLEIVAKNHQASIQKLEIKFNRLADKQSGRPSGFLSGNTQPNPKGNNSKAYQPLQSRNEHVNVVLTRSGKSYDPPDNPNDQQNNSKNPINFDSDDEDDEPTPQPKTNRSFQYPIGIAENMLVEVGKFTFPADFVILEMEEDSKVLLILGRPFLHTADAVIRVKQKQLNLGVGTKQMIFSIDSAMKHSYSNDDTCFSIDAIDEILKEDFDALLNEGSKILHSIEGTLLEE